MIKTFQNRFFLKLAVLAVVALPNLASAQFFNYNQYGDVLAGFRKTGVYAGNYELVVNLGNVTNLIKLSAGTTISITSFGSSQLTAAFPSGNGNLQWSVFSAFEGGLNPWVTPLGSFPKDTIWFTRPATGVGIQTTPPTRSTYQAQSIQRGLMTGVGSGAQTISTYLGVTNANNNTLLVREPTSYSTQILTALIGDKNDPTIGDFGSSGSALSQTVENTTPAVFSSAQRCDFYQVCPTSLVDPITGLTSGSGYLVGYFMLNPNGTMTFTRASASTPPAVGSVASTITNGFAPLQVVFTNSTTGSITNWVWNFGDGNIITNTTGGNVTNTYTAGGSYTVTLIVNGPGGSSTNVLTSYIVASPVPTIGSVTLSGANLVFGGANCPAGVQYRILSTTNVALPLASWKPVLTNVFLANGTYTYTNSTTNGAGYFRLVSP